MSSPLKPRAVARHPGTRALRAVLDGTAGAATRSFANRFAAQGKAAGKSLPGVWMPAAQAQGKFQASRTWSAPARAEGKGAPV